MWLRVFVVLFIRYALSDVKSRSRRHKHHRFKTAASTEQYYGTKLPTFAYDFSQLFLGAMIEQSVDGSLHLVVVMLDHQSVLEEYPLESLSTDEESLFKWSQAVGKWFNNSSPSPKLKSKARPKPRHAPHGITCVLNNNDPQHLISYASAAVVVPSSDPYVKHLSKQTSWNTSLLHPGFHITRCRVKGGLKMLVNASHHFLSVDLVNTNQLRTYSKQQKAKLHADSRQSTGSSSLTNQTSPAQHEYDVSVSLASFSVPWDTRTSGFGFSLQAPSLSTFDPSAEANLNISSRLHVCASALTDTGWRLTDDRSLFEAVRFVEYYLSVGVSHVFFAVLYDRDSVELKRIQKVFSSFIAAGQLTLLSYSLPGHDEIAGFEGVAVGASFAETLFTNQCIYYSKGVSDKVLVINSRKYIVPVTDWDRAESIGSLGSLVGSLLEQPSPGDGDGDASERVIKYFPMKDKSLGVSAIFVPTKHVCLWTPDATFACGAHSGRKGGSGASTKYNAVVISDAQAVTVEYPAKGSMDPTTARLQPILQHYLTTEVQSRLEPLQLSTLAQLKKLTNGVVWDSMGTPALPRGTEALREPFWLPCGKSQSLRDALLQAMRPALKRN